MSNQDWQDLIPFYVAGTLTEAEKREFERVLASDAAYQEQLQEWLIVAQGVREHVAAYDRALPPLKVGGRRKTQSPATRINRWVVLQTASRGRAPLTLAAAAVLMIFVFIMLILAAQMNTNNTAAPVVDEPCIVVNQTDDVVYIHEMPDADFAVSGALYPGDELPVSGRNDADWLRVDAPAGGIIGWVAVTDITTQGNCDVAEVSP